MATSKGAAKKPAPAHRAGAKTSMPKAGKDPKGGLTKQGREFFNKRDGSHLKPGVRTAHTPEEMKRKGSFLVRTFSHPRGPVVKNGEPTRLALSAHAWGEPVPKTEAAAHRLAAKGQKLLDKLHAQRARTAATKSAAKPAEKSAARKIAATKKTSAKPATKKAAATKR